MPVRLLALVALAGVPIAAVCLVYVTHEQPAYSWDWQAYFNAYRRYGLLFEKGGRGWLEMLSGTIRFDDYNMAILTPMLPSYVVFGGARSAYIATIAVIYLMPAAYLAAKLAVAVRTDGGDRPPLWLVSAAMLFWPLWFAVLRGMPDVAGLIPLAGATLLILGSRYLTRASIATGIATGLLIWCAFVLRRWYAYAGVSLEILTLGFAIGASLRDRTCYAKSLSTAAQAFAANVTTIVACLALCQKPLAIRILQTSYADLYLAYQKPLSTTGSLFAAQCGVPFMIATALGVARAVTERNDRVAFTTLLAGLTAILFLRTQAPENHHVLPIFFWLFPAFIFGATWLATTWAQRALPLLMLVSFLSVIAPPARNTLASIAVLLPRQTYFPLKLEHRQSYDRLIADLETMRRERPVRVAVFASSFTLSDTLLASLDEGLRRSLVGISNVDARDGLDLAPFRAEIAIVTTPAALHLPAWNQRVVTIPNDMIVDGQGPGAAYTKASGPYRLDEDVTAFIYRRNRPLTPDDAEALTRALQSFYPNWHRENDLIAGADVLSQSRVPSLHTERSSVAADSTGPMPRRTPAVTQGNI